MELTAIEPQLPRRRLWLQFVLTLCFITCLIVGLSSLAALVLLRNGSAAAEANQSLPAIDASAVSPQLALNQLAGDPAEALALQSASAGHFGTAQAILAYDVSIPLRSKAGLYQLLSRRVGESNLPYDVRQSEIKKLQRQARRVAILSPALDIPQRSQLLLQGTQDLLNIDETEDALRSATNLQRLAAQLPELLPAQRRQILEPLSPLLDQLGSPELEQRVAELLRNPFLTPNGTLLPLQLDNLLSSTLLDPTISAAIAVRQDAARQLINGINVIGSENTIAGNPQISTASQSEITQLANALRSEDLLRQQVTEPVLADLSQPPLTKLQALHNLHRWTTLKARVAVGGFGISIVPEWENSIASIEAELTTITQNIDQTTDLVMETLESAQDKAALRVEKFLWLALMADQGLYSGTSIQALSNDLRFAQTELANQGIELALPVFWDSSLDSPEFQIQPQ